MPALDVVEAQQQVDQRRLAGAGTLDQADPFARRDRQREVVDHAPGLAVVEPNVLEPDSTLRSLQRSRVGAIDQRAWPRDRPHALLHLSDIVEDPDRGPHRPARHEGDPEREPGRDGDVAQRHDGRAQSQTARTPTLTNRTLLLSETEGDQPGLAMERYGVIDERVASLLVLALEVSADDTAGSANIATVVPRQAVLTIERTEHWRPRPSKPEAAGGIYTDSSS